MQKRYKSLTAPYHQTGDEQTSLSYGINGSIRKRYDHQTQNTDYYYFNASGNLKACGTDMQISVYGYNSANTRTYKVNMFNANQWVNGHPQPIQPMVQSAMFYPNTYINFTQAGEYTKHYYNGTERIASRLGEQQVPVSVENEQELEAYKQDVKQIIYNAIGQHLYDEPTDIQEGDVIPLEFLQATGDNNAIFYYHPNHLASTMYVTDVQQSVVQSFLYAPYGDIISEYNPGFNGNVLPNYAFNAKELDEETDMYYYEARYYKPPVFTSRDPMFEKYFWMTPYAYCANNPVKYVDPSGCEFGDYYDENGNWVFNDGINDGRIYVEDQENGVFMGPLKQPLYRQVGTVTSVELTFTGEATNSKNKDNVDISKAEGTLSMIQHCDDGNDYVRFSFDATSGDYGNGSLENGQYSVGKGWRRSEKGYLQHDFGFCFPIIPGFETDRSELLIHPDGNKPGTKGCIGINSDLFGLKDFYKTMNLIIDNYGNIPLTVDILNNVNNNGSKSSTNKLNE